MKTINSTSWIPYIESKRTAIAWSMAIFCTILLIASANYGWLNYDSFWHLRTGLDWIENGLSPWRDHYSFTFYGEPIRSAYQFDVFYYGLVELFGEDFGGYAIRLIAFLLVLGCMLLWMKQIDAPAVAYLATLPLLVVALQQRALVRPELLSYPLIIVALMLYERARHQVNWRTMLPIALLMMIWTNYHSSIFGWVIFFGLFTDIGYRLLVNKAGLNKWALWMFWGLVVLLVGFLNPHFDHPILSMLNFSGEWKVLIDEYMPPIRHFTIGSSYVLVTVSILSLLLALQQRKIGYLVSMIIFLKVSMTTSRIMTPATIFGMAVLAHLLTDLKLDSRNRQWSRTANYLMVLVLAAIVVVPAYRAIKLAYLFATNEVSVYKKYPENIVEFMHKEDKHGRIFNEYQLGGYLLYHLSPKSKVYIDGRTNILYPLDFSKNYFSAKHSAAGLVEEFNTYDVEYAVLKNTYLNFRNMYHAGFQLEFSDQDYSLFSHSEGRLSAFGQVLAFPYCRYDGLEAELRGEWTIIDNDTYPPGEIYPFAKVVVGYLNTPSKPDYLAAFRIDRYTDNSVRRFIAYNAMVSGQNDIALNALALMRPWDFKDILAISFAHSSKKDFVAALETLSGAIRNPPENVEFNDLVIQQALLELISKHISFEEHVEQYFESLTDTVGDQRLLKSGGQLEVSAFCPTG